MWPGLFKFTLNIFPWASSSIFLSPEIKNKRLTDRLNRRQCMSNDEHFSWGKYAPKNRGYFLRFLIAVGFGRGAIRTKILETWKKKFGNLLDITVRGINYRLNLDDNVIDCKIFASSIIYDKKEINYLKNSCQDGVFVDIGANTGYYSLALAKEACCKVIAIEPNPPTINRLKFNVDINSELKKKIIIVPMGVGENGAFELYSGEDLGGASLHGSLFEKPNNKVTIQTKPLLDILATQNIKHVDALKIDVEGMEDCALGPFFEKAPFQMWPKCIVIEYDHQHMWKIDLFKRLTDKGYIEVSRSSGNVTLQLQKTAQTICIPG
jgi:FkbM family methyltransferase